MMSSTFTDNLHRPSAVTRSHFIVRSGRITSTDASDAVWKMSPYPIVYSLHRLHRRLQHELHEYEVKPAPELVTHLLERRRLLKTKLFVHAYAHLVL
jgi:hypothetical protein